MMPSIDSRPMYAARRNAMRIDLTLDTAETLALRQVLVQIWYEREFGASAQTTASLPVSIL
jgi:hypothetical protein